MGGGDPAGQNSVRDGRRGPCHRRRRHAPGGPQAGPPCAWRPTNWPSGPNSSAGTTRSNDMKAQKVRDLDDNALRQHLHEMDEQLFRLNFQMSMGQMEGLKKARGLKKDRARFQTILRERELAAENK